MNPRFGWTLFSCCVFIFCNGLQGCSYQADASEKYFVGKWKSSRLETPLYLHENGEWEIKKDDGAVLQYGVWQYKNKTILWSFKINSTIGHDINPVLLVQPNEFHLLESDRSTTVFKRLD
jgi:hypothetical protein